MIIGISGSSGSGKSFVVKYLIDNLPKDLISIVYQDNYYKNNTNYNYNKHKFSIYINFIWTDRAIDSFKRKIKIITKSKII